MHTLILRFVAAQVLELALKLTSYKHFFRCRLDPEQIDVLHVKLLQFYLVEAESR